jgi:hypothetical protein
MRESHIRVCHERRFKAMRESKHSLPVQLNLLDRNFSAAKSNRACSAEKS